MTVPLRTTGNAMPPMTAPAPAYRTETRRDEPAVALQPLMTPARRIALDALEREFADLLKPARA